MKEILSVYGITKETVDAIMILYHDTSSMVRSPDGDTDFFDNSAGVLQGDSLAYYIYILYVLTMYYVKLWTRTMNLALSSQSGRANVTQL